jgi:hypothetical protein
MQLKSLRLTVVFDFTFCSTRGVASLQEIRSSVFGLREGKIFAIATYLSVR